MVFSLPSLVNISIQDRRSTLCIHLILHDTGGPRGVPSGALIYGGVCAAGQVVYTAANKWRRDTILRKQREEETGIIADEPKKSFWDYFEMPSWAPIRMISNTEYDDMLDTQLKNLETEIEELEKLIKENKKKDP